MHKSPGKSSAKRLSLKMCHSQPVITTMASNISVNLAVIFASDLLFYIAFMMSLKPNVSLACKCIRLNESGPRARRENQIR